jgi:hypothetical protein
MLKSISAVAASRCSRPATKALASEPIASWSLWAIIDQRLKKSVERFTRLVCGRPIGGLMAFDR